MKQTDKKIFYLYVVLVIIVVACVFVSQQKKINHLANRLNDLDEKANQSGLAAKVALQQSTELVQAIEANQEDVEQAQAAWENRELIGFKTPKG